MSSTLLSVIQSLSDITTSFPVFCVNAISYTDKDKIGWMNGSILIGILSFGCLKFSFHLYFFCIGEGETELFQNLVLNYIINLTCFSCFKTIYSYMTQTAALSTS